MSADNSQKRLAVVLNHVAGGPAAFQPAKLAAFLDFHDADYRADILKRIYSDPLFKPVYNLKCEEHRELTLQRVKRVLSWGIFDCKDYTRNPLKFMAFLEAMGWVDYSLAIKLGVHFTLCSGTLQALGTKKHEWMLDDLNKLKLGGSFAMTELGHGSNVMGIDTVAHYDAKTQEFVLKTPNEGAQKFWIGHVACHGNLTCAFAHLITPDGKNHGIHVFAVRMRDDNGQPCPNIRLADNGYKMGLNGVDNGRIWFDDARVPRDALLDKYGSVSADGKYESKIADPNVRFATMISGLVSGRVLIASQALLYSRLGLSIAIRYSHHRLQFGPKNKENPIMSYLTQQRWLYPALATTVVLTGALNHLKQLFAKKTPEAAKQIHLLASGLKAWSTWHRSDTLIKCRESCGGQGFAAHNQFGAIIADTEVDKTFEGQNTVMMQQLSKDLIADMKKKMSKGQNPFAGLAKPADIKFDDLKFYIAAFEFRDKSLSQKLGVQLEKFTKSGQSFDEAYNNSMDLCLAVAWASIESSALKIFAQQLVAADASIKPVLHQIALLHASFRMELDSAFFLASGLLTAQQADQLRLFVNGQCSKIYKEKTDLEILKGLGVPEQAITAPIAYPDYIARHTSNNHWK